MAEKPVHVQEKLTCIGRVCSRNEDLEKTKANAIQLKANKPVTVSYNEDEGGSFRPLVSRLRLSQEPRSEGFRCIAT